MGTENYIHLLVRVCVYIVAMSHQLKLIMFLCLLIQINAEFEPLTTMPDFSQLDMLSDKLLNIT